MFGLTETATVSTKVTGRPPVPLTERQEAFSRFIDAIENGESIREATHTAGRSWRTLSDWMTDQNNVTVDGATFAARYARARSFSAEMFADKALTTALDARETTEGVQLARLQVDTYKWRAAMANPKEYGDRRQVDTNVTVKMLPVEERDRALARLTAKATLANPLTVTKLATVEDADCSVTT